MPPLVRARANAAILTVAMRRHAKATDANPRKPTQRNVPVAKRRQVSTTCLVMIDTEHFQPQMDADEHRFFEGQVLVSSSAFICVHLWSNFECEKCSTDRNARRKDEYDRKVSRPPFFRRIKFSVKECRSVMPCTLMDQRRRNQVFLR